MSALQLTSDDITDGGTFEARFEYDGFGCSGQNRSPSLQWKEAPVGTKSFAVTCYDPDAPTGSGWWHWFVINIPAGTFRLESNAGVEGGAQLPAGARHIRNDFGAKAWGGMCPPEGSAPHRYIFTVHALSVESLDLPEDASCALAGFMLNVHTLEKVQLTGLYSR